MAESVKKVADQKSASTRMATERYVDKLREIVAILSAKVMQMDGKIEQLEKRIQALEPKPPKPKRAGTL